MLDRQQTCAQPLLAFAGQRCSEPFCRGASVRAEATGGAHDAGPGPAEGSRRRWHADQAPAGTARPQLSVGWYVLQLCMTCYHALRRHCQLAEPCSAAPCAWCRSAQVAAHLPDGAVGAPVRGAAAAADAAASRPGRGGRALWAGAVHGCGRRC